jgi:hypothetical protein
LNQSCAATRSKSFFNAIDQTHHRRIDQARAEEHMSSGAALVAELEKPILACIEATSSDPITFPLDQERQRHFWPDPNPSASACCR